MRATFSHPIIICLTTLSLANVAMVNVAMASDIISPQQTEEPTTYLTQTSPVSSPTSTSRPYIALDLMATAYSPTQPIKSFINDWDAPLESGDYAYAQGRMALSMQPNSDGWLSYGLGWRYDYLMSFSEPTAEIYGLYQNKTQPPVAAHYPLRLEAKHNERVGANIGFTHRLSPNVQVTTQVNAWQGLHALDGTIVGNATTRSAPLNENENIRDSLGTVNAVLDYYYDEPALGEENLGWDYGSPNGYGYSLDIGMQANLTPDTSLTVQGFDVLGRMHWQDMPSTQYLLSYDVNGRPLYSLEGQLSKEDVTQKLPWRLEGSLHHQLTNDWQLGLHGQVNDVTSLYQLSASHHFDMPALPAPISLTGLLEPQTQAIGFAVDTPYIGIKVLTDDVNFDESKRNELSLYGRYSW